MEPDIATGYFTYLMNIDVGKFTYLLATKPKIPTCQDSLADALLSLPCVDQILFDMVKNPWICGQIKFGD